MLQKVAFKVADNSGAMHRFNGCIAIVGKSSRRATFKRCGAPELEKRPKGCFSNGDSYAVG